MTSKDLIAAFAFLLISLHEEGLNYVYDHDDIRFKWKGLPGTWH
jgi:hypothetical protein